MADEDILEHDVVARIVRRAGELSERMAPRDDTNGISEAALVAAAGEVGLPIDAVRRSIALERLGSPPPTHIGDRIVGPALLVVDGVVAGSQSEVLAKLDDWMVHGHHLRRDRLRDGTAAWSRRSGVAGAAMRTVRGATGEGQLGHFRRITATAHDAGDDASVVRVAVDRSHGRAAATGGGIAMAAGGTAGVVVGAVVASPFVLIGAPFAVLAGLGVAMTGRSRALRTALEVERVLDAVTDHVEPVPLRTDVVTRVRGRGRDRAERDRARRSN